MTEQEFKELIPRKTLLKTMEKYKQLLQDLCARIPYGVSINYKNNVYVLLGIAHGRCVLAKPFSSATEKDCPLVEEVKPYLRPLDELTKEQDDEYMEALFSSQELNKSSVGGILNFYNKYHIDYNNLINEGLAFNIKMLENKV